MPELFSVEEVVELPQLTKDGRVVYVYEIRYVTRSGVRGKIQVPKEKLDPTNVKQLITEEAQKLEAIKNLKG